MDYRFINTGYLDMVTGGDSGLVKEIVDIFREQVGEMRSEMRSLLEAGDYAALGELAHKAKSSVAIMGMDNLADMLKTLEISAKTGSDAELYESYISRFDNETSSALSELDDLISNL